ncbi:hypothetical protein Tco_0916526 [Tanacetum coccineum]|uniref:Uncharacterized protein n=1 Tax=Tanacetum coccineum TaxID=301880 RepID=A0ABQ5HVN4_9ASTR
MPHESPLQSVHSLGRDEGSLSLTELMVLCTSLSMKVDSLEYELKKTKQTYNTTLIKLILRVKKLEKTVKTTKARGRARIVILEDEDAAKDSSKQGRKIFEIDKDPTISLEDVEIQEKISDDTEVVIEQEEPIELVEDQGSGEKGEKEVSTVGAEHSTVIQEVSTTTANLVHEEAIRLQEHIDEEERQRIARDAKIAKQLQEEINIAEKKEAVAKVDQAHVINWNDPSVIRYHALQNRPQSVAKVRKNMCIYLKNQGGYKMSDFKRMSYDDIRPIFKKVWDYNHTFVPKDSKIEKEVMKRTGFDLQQESTQKNENIKAKQVKENIVQQEDVVAEQVMLESSKKVG